MTKPGQGFEKRPRRHSQDTLAVGSPSIPMMRCDLNLSGFNLQSVDLLISFQLKVMVHQYLKVSYARALDARETQTDILRVNPNFHGSPRYDYALIKVNKSHCMLAQLLSIFTINYQDKRYHMALILLMDRLTLTRNRTRDRALGLTRVRSFTSEVRFNCG